MPLRFRAAAAAILLVAAWPSANAAEPASQRSAFEGYRPFADEPVADWRATNDRVGRIGGWQAYAREAAAAAQAASAAASAAASRPAPAAPAAPEGGHDGHHPGQRR
jgi:hypothetical protein